MAEKRVKLCWSSFQTSPEKPFPAFVAVQVPCWHDCSSKSILTRLARGWLNSPERAKMMSASVLTQCVRAHFLAGLVVLVTDGVESLSR